MATELGASQISTLLEALPGIASVLRSPVADALLNVIRAAARVADFHLADAEELIRYATRRSLVGVEEGERALEEVRQAVQRRAAKESEREKNSRAKPKSKPSRKPGKKSRK